MAVKDSKSKAPYRAKAATPTLQPPTKAPKGWAEEQWRAALEAGPKPLTEGEAVAQYQGVFGEEAWPPPFSLNNPPYPMPIPMGGPAPMDYAGLLQSTGLGGLGAMQPMAAGPIAPRWSPAARPRWEDLSPEQQNAILERYSREVYGQPYRPAPPGWTPAQSAREQERAYQWAIEQSELGEPTSYAYQFGPEYPKEYPNVPPMLNKPSGKGAPMDAMLPFFMLWMMMLNSQR